ncbi:SPFH domain-containing protein [Moorena sp. SIO3I6]|uniref:SPFH domain-containing protein n=1 Tax=Moorena sp. SIO3I6 TaxID=2607831 RepID=UPI0013FC77CD|nr:SPFH domain-containing protein [Moorena sp. SIO3I6]NEP24971.1 VWA domain-containing protein [Moorena sp. SIO3I6]
MNTLGMVEIGANEVGIVRKKNGQKLPPGRYIAINEEAGYQADILPPGRYFGFFSWKYEVRREPIINIPRGEIGLVVAKDGQPIPRERSLGRVVECNDFQDARAFLENGGEKGSQLGILSAGIYQINTELFTVITSANAIEHGMNPEDLRVYKVEADKIGIVTTYDGKPIPVGEIAGSSVGGHDNFQNPQQFIDRGGFNGLQEEVISTGSWNLNPWFVKIEQVPLTKIEPGRVGVIVSHVGRAPHTDRNELVDSGYKGVWKTPLYTGKHSINTRVMDVLIVPTHEITLDWSNKEKPPTNYDAKLRALKLRSKDGYVFDIEVTQVISIDAKNAPKMISRIGSQATRISAPSDAIEPGQEKLVSIRNLVTRVLEPMVGNYFRNSAQDYKAIDFHDKRSERQKEAVAYITPELDEYGVRAIGTFINEIDLPDELEKILNEREKTKQEAETLKEKINTEDIIGQLAQAKAKTSMQAKLVESEADIVIARNQAHADSMRAQGQAASIQAIGKAEAEVLGAKLSAEVEALGGPQYFLAKVRAENLPQIQLPQVLVDSNGSHSGLLDAFVAPMLLGNPITQLPLLNPAIGGKQPALPTTGSTKLPQLEASLPRYPIVLLLDTSSSMPGEYLEQLVQGINTFDQELVKDETVCRCVEVAIVTLSNSAKVVQSFTTAGNFSVHELELSGTAATGRGIELALKIIENRKSIYKNQNLPLCPPWIVLITGSAPSDNWQNAAQQVKQEVAAEQLNFLAVGVEGADMDILNQISPPQFPATKLKDWKFAPLFHGLAHQMKRIIHYQEKEALLQGLVQVVEQAKSALSPEQAKKLDEYTTKLMVQVSKEQPSRQEYTDNAAGLYREARDIGEDGKPITELLPNITKRLGFS